jgi:Protein of unknown function (DUF4256)
MTNVELKRELASEPRTRLFSVLKTRFEKNMHRHRDLEWNRIEARLTLPDSSEKLWNLNEMERTGGEPDVVGFDARTGAYIFYDCSAESPAGRRNVCYDSEALDARKTFKPENSAVEMANAMGSALLNEKQYRELQDLGNFDMKTSSWIETPAEIRKLGGALFADRRYGTVFVYHNGAQSYYGARGFRVSLKV